jgi:hypothetical protein
VGRVTPLPPHGPLRVVAGRGEGGVGGGFPSSRKRGPWPGVEPTPGPSLSCLRGFPEALRRREGGFRGAATWGGVTPLPSHGPLRVVAGRGEEGVGGGFPISRKRGPWRGVEPTPGPSLSCLCGFPKALRRRAGGFRGAATWGEGLPSLHTDRCGLSPAAAREGLGVGFLSAVSGGLGEVLNPPPAPPFVPLRVSEGTSAEGGGF